MPPCKNFNQILLGNTNEGTLPLMNLGCAEPVIRVLAQLNGGSWEPWGEGHRREPKRAVVRDRYNFQKTSKWRRAKARQMDSCQIQGPSRGKPEGATKSYINPGGGCNNNFFSHTSFWEETCWKGGSFYSTKGLNGQPPGYHMTLDDDTESVPEPPPMEEDDPVTNYRPTCFQNSN